jgi:hypothetical protein
MYSHVLSDVSNVGILESYVTSSTELLQAFTYPMPVLAPTLGITNSPHGYAA